MFYENRFLIKKVKEYCSENFYHTDVPYFWLKSDSTQIFPAIKKNHLCR